MRRPANPLPALLASLSALALGACGGEREDATGFSAAAAEPALETIEAAELAAHVDTLASDAFEGRAPGTEGEEKTVAYLIDAFEAMGLQPGNPDGGWTQDVTLVGIRNRATGSLAVGDRTIPLRFPDDFVAVSYRDAESVEVEDSELVFVGYGVDAPEYDWDDYAGQDMSGKTLVMLVNDPPVRLPGDTALDPEMFNGRAMTYYGRWTYKYEVGAEKGADAVIIVHETGPAGYPWEVVSGSWGPEQFGIAGDGGAMPVAVEAWITERVARRLFDAAGHEFDELKERARTPGFQPVPLSGTASLRVDMERRQVASRNVLARLPGSDQEVADEHVVYTAHWDHLGRDTTLQGDQIFNGALDNATGTAGLLEIAEAFAVLPRAPRRSILFLAVTAEEKGLLGARYYAENPLYPLEKTLANINMDGLNIWGPTEDVVVIGMGNSTLDDVARRHAGERTLIPDPEPEKGYFYRSDHFQFAKEGVPALYMDAGNTFVGQPADYGQRMRERYTANDYHKPSDEVTDDWNLEGAVEDLRLMFLVGYDVASGTEWPTWSEGTEFKARREAMLGHVEAR